MHHAGMLPVEIVETFCHAYGKTTIKYLGLTVDDPTVAQQKVQSYLKTVKMNVRGPLPSPLPKISK